MYKTIAENKEAEINIKKSNFIANCFFVSSEEEAKNIIEEVSKKNYKANHNCYAYRIHGDLLIEKSSDNKEPQGTAGLPILECIRGYELENVLVIVTRYFGGIKLGTGGLVRAYGGATKEVLSIAKIVLIENFVRVLIELDYSNLGKVEYYFNKNKVVLENTDYGENVAYNVLIREEELNFFINEITEILNGNIKISKKDEVIGYLKDNKIIEI